MPAKATVRLALTAALAAVVLLAVTAAVGVQQVSTTYSMPTSVKASIKASGCNNSPGPYITLQGEIALGGLGVELIFKNNEKGTHTLVVQKTADVVLIPAGQSVALPKQPVRGGVGGNPFIFVQFVDERGGALSGEFYLGRCVQGLFNVGADMVTQALATAVVAAGECDNSGGPNITLSGELRLSGINARIIFKNNDNPVGGPHTASVSGTVDVVVLPAGQTIQFPKQPVLGGVGGNPLISLVFLDGRGQAVSGEFSLGRCNKI